MRFYEEIMKTIYGKHKGHNLTKKYEIEGYFDQHIRFCKDCDIALLYFDELI